MLPDTSGSLLQLPDRLSPSSVLHHCTLSSASYINKCWSPGVKGSQTQTNLSTSWSKMVKSLQFFLQNGFLFSDFLTLIEGRSSFSSTLEGWNTWLIVWGGDKRVESKTVRWTPQGCLVGKYKPFGKKIKFLAWKKTWTVHFYKYVFTNKFFH